MPNPDGAPVIAGKKKVCPVRDQQIELEEFRRLPPVEPREMVGLWKGRGIPAGHPFDGVLENKDVVISAIGVKGTGPTTLYSLGNSHLLDAMKRKGVRRIFFISASALDISPVLPFFIRLVAKYVVQKILRNMYADLREMEHLVKTSDANWTIMRPPRLTDKSATGHYRFAINSFLKNCLKISRADLAHFMIHNVTNEATYKTTIEIGY